MKICLRSLMTAVWASAMTRTTAEGGERAGAENSLTGEPHLAFAQRSLGGSKLSLERILSVPLSLGLLTCGALDT